MATPTIQAPPPQWLRDLTNPAPVKKSKGLLDPPGFTPSSALTHTPTSNNTNTKPSSKNASKATSLAPSSPAAPTTAVTTPRKQPTPEEMDTLKLKKAWEIAFAPAKQLPMNAIGMYMTGNSLQIFSIMMVIMLFKGPIQALLNLHAPFQRLETDGNRGQMLLVKAAFVGSNILALGLGMWKVNAMGLLPTTRSDWLAWETAREPLERAYFIG